MKINKKDFKIGNIYSYPSYNYIFLLLDTNYNNDHKFLGVNIINNYIELSSRYEFFKEVYEATEEEIERFMTIFEDSEFYDEYQHFLDYNNINYQIF